MYNCIDLKQVEIYNIKIISSDEGAAYERVADEGAIG